MARVPRNRYSQIEKLRAGRQKAIIVGGVPIPAGENSLALSQTEFNRLLRAEIRDEIDSQPELVRTLERGRFRNSFFEEVRLPSRVAESLEDFEAGLRAAGLMSFDEMLVQSFTRPTKFRVQKVRVGKNGHSGFSSGFSGHGDDKRSPALSNCAVGRPRVKGEGVPPEASVTSRLTGPRPLVRKKGP